MNIGTLIMRLITIPIAIYNQRNAGQMQIHMPKLQELQGKLQEARIRNDQLASRSLLSLFHTNPSCLILVMRAGNDLMEFMKHSEIKPMKAMIGPFMQVKQFILIDLLHQSDVFLDAILYFLLSWYSWFS